MYFNAITRMVKVLEILYLLCGLDPLLTVKFPVGLVILTKLDSPDTCDLADANPNKFGNFWGWMGNPSKF